MLDRSGPTALVCVSDALALGALAELSARGLRPGVDVAVVGFDDTDIAQVVGLSSITQPLIEVADACARLLVDTLAAPSLVRSTARNSCTPRLVVRGSSAGPATQPT